ncbi:MAG: hypothetical protein J7K84_07095 [Deltaproteobacteria bacterium]|nr:hypothetical protein [Deltaproteobacteria bacterium]
MPETTKEQTYRLVALQQVETDIKINKASIENLPDKLAKIDAELNHAEEIVNKNEALLKDYSQKYRSYESDTEINRSKIKKSETKLESVKNNKEYQSSLKEISELKSKNSKIEDDMIQYLDKIDEIEDEIKSLKNDYKKIAERIKIKKNELKNQVKNDEQELIQLYAERDKIIESVQKDLIKKFLIIQEKQPNGVAIVQAKNSICCGCNMNIPPQMYNNLQRCNSLEFCPFCNRILYWQQEE